MAGIRANAKTICFFAITIVSSLTHESYGQDQNLSSLYEKTVDLYLHERFDEAIALGKQIREEFPENPAGAFGLLSTYQSMKWNYRVRRFDATIDSLIDLSMELSKKAQKKNKKDGTNYFYMGCALGFRTMRSARAGHWMSAFRDGSQAPRYFKKAIVYNPEFYDAYYGLGLQKYWLGAKGAMRYLPFSAGKRKAGIEQMKLTAEKGRFLKINAMYGLMAVYQNEKQYEQALELANTLTEMFPNNPTTHYKQGRLLQQFGEWEKSNQSFEKLQRLLVAAPYQCTSYKVEALYQQARNHYESKNLFQTQRLCDEAMALLEVCDFSGEMDGPMESFSEIKENLLKLNKAVESDLLTDSSKKE